ncbi:hypothetical protein OG264_37205 [Streptomyces xanthophaeus]|uniref:hypothetical protein n=1 Tax=Streptomyces xanthophaeus TaxID=67385 RepID=UPI00386F126C|nr:hypothetical protein OG264_37205 [Streptomyces xanthophaeus]WST58358.1 hypothetical protein OG605_01230 [Streptomyces xanthophaeus]
MQHIEFFTYGPSPLWGVRVDGSDLRVHAADATRPLWAQEKSPYERTPESTEEFLFHQYGGMSESDLGDPALHFLGGAAQDLRHEPTGSTVVLGCTCGVWECWPLFARITATPEAVTWSGFRQPHRRAWGELAMGPFVFPRPAYEDALAHAVHHAEDPFTALPPPKQ